MANKLIKRRVHKRIFVPNKTVLRLSSNQIHKFFKRVNIIEANFDSFLADEIFFANFWMIDVDVIKNKNIWQLKNVWRE